MAKKELTIETNLSHVLTGFQDVEHATTNNTKAVNDYNQTQQKVFGNAGQALTGIGKNINDATKSFKNMDDALKSISAGPILIKKIQTEIRALQKSALEAGEGSKKFVENTLKIGSLKGEIMNLQKEMDLAAKSIKKMDDNIKPVQKTGNIIKELRGEIRKLETDAIAAGVGSEKFIEKLNEAGHLKTEIRELENAIKATTGTITSKLGGAVTGVVSTGVAGFEGLISAQALFGAETEQTEKLLVKLQAVANFAGVIKEFGDWKEKVAEFKLVLAPLQKLYTESNSALLNFAKGGAKNLELPKVSLKSLAKDFTSGFASMSKTVISSMKSIGTAIATNPLGILLIAVVALTAVAVYLANAMDDVSEETKKLAETSKEVTAEMENQNKAIEDQIIALGNLKSKEKERENLERQKLKNNLTAAQAQKDAAESAYNDSRKSLLALKLVSESTAGQFLKTLGTFNAGFVNGLDIVSGKTKEKALEDYRKGVEALEKFRHTEAELAGFENTAQQKHLDEAEKNADKRKKIAKDLADALLDLEKRSEHASLDLLDAREKIVKINNIGQAEIDHLEKTIIEKGRLANKDFKLTEEQQHQIGVLRAQINKKTEEDLLKLQLDGIEKRAQANKREADSLLQAHDLKMKLKIAEVNGQKKSTGIADVDFELIKQKQILEIEKEGARESLEIKLNQLQAESELQIVALDNEIKLLGDKNDEVSNVKKKEAQDSINALREKLGLEKKILIKETSNQIDALAKEINGIDKKIEEGKKFDLAKLLGISGEDLNKLKDGLKTFLNEATKAFTEYNAMQQEMLQKQIEATQKQIDQRQANIDDLKNQLSHEYDLQRQGLANNVEGLKKNIKDQQQEKEKALIKERQLAAEKQKLARQQLILDTITQGANLVTAASSLYKSLAGIVIGPVPVGVIIATAAIASMIAAFTAAKARAFQAISVSQNQTGFEKGGYTGDMGTKQVAGVVHGKEFVNTAETTTENRQLLEGLHKKDRKLIEIGIYKLLENTGITISADAAKNVRKKREALTVSNHTMQVIQSNKPDPRISRIEQMIEKIVDSRGDKDMFDAKGNLFQKRGPLTRIIKSNNP